MWWIPSESGPAEGAYVSYPLEDLLGIIALESRRHRCVVIGEDLDTVPEGFRKGLTARGLLSYRVVMFERDPDSQKFLAPDAYPELAAAAVSTHDLVTVKGFWTGRDLEVCENLNLYPSKDSALSARAFRAETKTQLLGALQSEGLLSPTATSRLLQNASPASDNSTLEPLIAALHLFLDRTPSRLL